jgi:capsular exopolysaccharide synthesis family protein
MAASVLAPIAPRWNPPPPEDGPEFADEPRRGFEFRATLAAVRRRGWWIVAIVALAVAAGVIYTLLQTPLYTAQASVQINDQSERVLRAGEDLGEVNNNLYDERFLKTQIDILKSRGLGVRVAQKLKLFGNQRFYREMGVAIGPGMPDAVVRDLTVGLLSGRLAVDLPYDSRIATIAFTSGDPALSAEIANAFSTEFIQSNLQRKYDSSAYARNFVADQLAEAKDRLEVSERAVNDYARGAGLIRTRDALSDGSDEKTSGGGGGSVTTASLIQLNAAANEARAARIAAEGRWRALNSVPAMSAREVIGNGTVQTLLGQRAALRAKLEELRAGHLDDYPGVAETKAQLAETDRQIAAMAANVRNSVRSDYTAALASERALETQVERLKGATLSEQDRSVQYNLLAREADTNRSLYDGLLQRYKELNAAAGVATSNISIIDQAEPPLGPSSPNLTRNILLAALLGLSLAALLVFLAVQFDDAIRVPEDIEQKLDLPLLGVIPRSESTPETAFEDPKSPLSEAYNALRAALLHSSPEGLPPVLLVTSAQAGEGKTTSSQAIAATLARLGRRVLLVDGDLRRPAIHRLFGIGNERGLSDLLTSLDPLESGVVASAEPNLSLLPSGPLPPSPTELTSSNRFRALIDEMAEKFDVVVIDSPPILGLADAPAMAASVDGVIVVVESDRSRRGGLKAALRRLRAMRPNLLGALLTKFDTSRSANRYSEYYGSQYYEYRTEGDRA